MGKLKVAPKRVLGDLIEVWAKVEIYRSTVFCVAGPHENLSGYVRWRQRRIVMVPPRIEVGALYFPATAKVGGIVWLPRVPRRPEDYGAMSHEVGHAILDLMSTIDVTVSAKHQEPFCYAIGFVVESLLTELRRKARRTSP